MKLEKLSRLFSAYNQVTPENQAKNAQNAAQESSKAPATEAVRISNNFGYAGDSSEEARALKVAQLKKAVQEGTYKPDTRDVAKALANELFV
jgi:flagellar biosynthesis anti-sigma factor FlgM